MMLDLLLPLLLTASQALPPVITPAAGTYAEAQTVAVKALSSGSIVRCTTDGSTPSLSSTRYQAPLTVSSSATVKCAAWVRGKRTSTVASSAYVIAPGSCANEAMRSTGTTYYVCDCQSGAAVGCVAGSDSNAGTLASAPWQSWSKAMTQFKAMNGGDTVALCRGGSWNGVSGSNAAGSGDSSSNPQTILNANCTAASTCDFRDYASPSFSSSALPRINPTTGIEMFGFGRSRWNSQGYTATPIKGFRILNLDLVANGNGALDAIRIYGKTEDVEICGLTVRDGWKSTLSMVTSSTVQRVNFHHNRVTNNPFGIGAIYNSSCAADCTFDSNYFDLNGGAVDRDHSFYIGSAIDPQGQFPDQLCYSPSACYIRAQRTRVTNNEFYRSARGAGSSCLGTALVGHEPHDDLLIENNIIYEAPGTAADACFGIQLSSGGDAPSSFRRAIIRRNQLYNVGAKGIAVSQCSNCAIDSNLVVSPRAGGIIFPEETQAAAAGSEASANTSVRHNTVYNSTLAVNANAGDGGVNEGTGHIVANNVVCGTGAATALGSGATGYSNRTLSNCTGFFNAPGTNPLTADFTPASGSPLIGAGNATYATPAIGSVPWSATDAGKARDASPDQGAFER